MVSSDPLIARIAARLLPEPQAGADGAMLPDWQPDQPFDRPPVPAAVLIALVERPTGLSVLYTERSPDLRSHSGQISFPGGRIDPGDAGPGAAALREANEEVGLARGEAEIIGFMPQYFTGSNYLITPVVARVFPSSPFVPNPAEVRSVFEVPLSMLERSESFEIFDFKRGERRGQTWQIRHGDFVIWGITANLTRRFHEMALAREAA